MSLTVPEMKSEYMIPMYPKAKVYSEINTEYSIEELRAFRYLKRKSLFFGGGATNQTVQMMEPVRISNSKLMKYLLSFL